MSDEPNTNPGPRVVHPPDPLPAIEGVIARSGRLCEGDIRWLIGQVKRLRNAPCPVCSSFPAPDPKDEA